MRRNWMACLGVHHFVATEFDAAELDGIASMKRSELKREMAIGITLRAAGVGGSNMNMGQRSLGVGTLILQHLSTLHGLTQGNRSGCRNQCSNK